MSEQPALIVLKSDGEKKSPSLCWQMRYRCSQESIPQRFWSSSSVLRDDFLLVHAADQDSDASAAPHPTLAVIVSACRYCDGELVPRAESIASAEGCPPVRKATMTLAR